ncbi:MAG: TlpA family protein disulfide reductase, partial [Gammaproteobacteria bacterium]|nr:TlpA family protein disulfide reductase [Gammaproteobacteria bacterium]
MAGETGKPRPEFSLNDLTGTPRRVREWDGRLLFVNFWATWCPPCLREIPTFIELQDRYGSRGLQFLGVAVQDPVPV